MFKLIEIENKNEGIFIYKFKDDELTNFGKTLNILEKNDDKPMFVDLNVELISGERLEFDMFLIVKKSEKYELTLKMLKSSFFNKDKKTQIIKYLNELFDIKLDINDIKKVFTKYKSFDFLINKENYISYKKRYDTDLNNNVKTSIFKDKNTMIYLNNLKDNSNLLNLK